MNKRIRIKTQKEIIEDLKRTPIIEIVCNKHEIARSTFYRWRESNKKFSKQVDDAIQEGRLFMNDYAESQLIAAIRDKNISAIFFWLRNNHPAYTDKLLIKGKLENTEELTKEQKQAVKQALKLASLDQ